MLAAFFRSVGLLFDGRILGILGACTLLSLGCFVAAWFGMSWLLTTVVPEGWWKENWLLDLAGGAAAAVAAWFLFPMVTTALVCLFLDRIARIVEARDYRDLPPAPGLPLMQAVGSSIRFLAVVIAINVLLLLLLALSFVLPILPLVVPIAFLVLNGMLLGREYFELVALRRVDVAAARTMRRRNSNEILLGGAGFAALALVPFVNLVLPVLATGTMVHRFEAWRRAAAQHHAVGG